METDRRHTVAANVRVELARRRIRQTSLAEALGMSQTALSRRLAGDVAFDVDELARVARHLGVATSDLLGSDVVTTGTSGAGT